MPDWLLILLIVLGVFLVLIVVLAILGNKMQKKQDSSLEQMRASSQQISMLIIDKKRMKLKDANLPKVVLDQTPKYLHRSKVPIVKAKAGPNVMSFMCDNKIFDQIPIKKEVKAQVSGIYIIDVKGLRGATAEVPVKKGLRAKLIKAKKENDANLADMKKEKKSKKK